MSTEHRNSYKDDPTEDERIYDGVSEIAAEQVREDGGFENPDRRVDQLLTEFENKHDLPEMQQPDWVKRVLAEIH